MASITKHKERWRAFIFRHGHRETKVFDTKREAQAWAIRKESELDGAKMRGGVHTFADAAMRYLTDVSPKKDSLAWETNKMAWFVERFGANRLTDITSDTIGKWRNDRLRTVTGSTVRREANLLRSLFSVARDEWKWIKEHPFEGVTLPEENPPRETVWDWKLIKRVLRAPCSGKTAEAVRAFRIALHTALRLKEALNFQYDPGNRVILLGIGQESVGGATMASRTKGSKRGQKVRVPTMRRARKLLSGPSFTVGPNEAGVLFGQFVRRCGIKDLTFHDSRATALTLMSRRMDVMTLAKISRHKDINILQNTYYRESAAQISNRI